MEDQLLTLKKKAVGIASKGYYGHGMIDQGSMFNKSIHVTILGNNLCSDIYNLQELITLNKKLSTLPL